MSLHPILARAAEEALPSWAVAGKSRVAHVRRVSRLLGEWANELGYTEEVAARWRAVGILHDALRDAPVDDLRRALGHGADDLSDHVLHGPAAADRLHREGVRDEAFLRAVAFHTIGHPDLDEMGRHLYVADFVEPGRKRRQEWLAELRGRMPKSFDAVLVEVASTRLGRIIESRLSLPMETVAFWNGLVDSTDG